MYTGRLRIGLPVESHSEFRWAIHKYLRQRFLYSTFPLTNTHLSIQMNLWNSLSLLFSKVPYHPDLRKRRLVDLRGNRTLDQKTIAKLDHWFRIKDYRCLLVRTSYSRCIRSTLNRGRTNIDLHICINPVNRLRVDVHSWMISFLLVVMKGDVCLASRSWTMGGNILLFIRQNCITNIQFPIQLSCQWRGKEVERKRWEATFTEPKVWPLYTPNVTHNSLIRIWWAFALPNISTVSLCARLWLHPDAEWNVRGYIKIVEIWHADTILCVRIYIFLDAKESHKTRSRHRTVFPFFAVQTANR